MNKQQAGNKKMETKKQVMEKIRKEIPSYCQPKGQRSKADLVDFYNHAKRCGLVQGVTK